MHLFYFYVPESHLESVKSAVFAVGAGRIGKYEACAWQSKGMGQFRPLSDSQPFLGQSNQLEQVVEYKVEMVVEDHLCDAVIAALKESHPYEEPAFGLVALR